MREDFGAALEDLDQESHEVQKRLSMHEISFVEVVSDTNNKTVIEYGPSPDYGREEGEVLFNYTSSDEEMLAEAIIMAMSCYGDTGTYIAGEPEAD